MWKEIPLKDQGSWPPGVRLPIIISIHHQAEEACVQMADGQPDPVDFHERQYGGRRGAWRLLEIMAKHDVRGTWIKEQHVRCDGSGKIVEYQVNMMVTFVLDD